MLPWQLYVWLSISWVHIGATWQIQLNRPCAMAMRPMLNYFDHLLVMASLSFKLVCFVNAYLRPYLCPFWDVFGDFTL